MGFLLTEDKCSHLCSWQNVRSIDATVHLLRLGTLQSVLLPSLRPVQCTGMSTPLPLSAGWYASDVLETPACEGLQPTIDTSRLYMCMWVSESKLILVNKRGSEWFSVCVCLNVNPPNSLAPVTHNLFFAQLKMRMIFIARQVFPRVNQNATWQTRDVGSALTPCCCKHSASLNMSHQWHKDYVTCPALIQHTVFPLHFFVMLLDLEINSLWRFS